MLDRYDLRDVLDDDVRGTSAGKRLEHLECGDRLRNWLVTAA